MPRSGTSWLSQIFDSHPDVRFRLSPLFSYEFKNQLDENSTKDAWEVVLRGAYESSNEFMDQTRRRTSGEYPVFAKKNAQPSRLVVKDTRFHNLTRLALNLLPNLFVVAIIRHPCGAIHSWLTTQGEFPSQADPLLEWRSGSCRKSGYGEFWGFEDWKLVTAEHLALEEEFPGRVHIQRYEDLVSDPVPQVERLFNFVGLKPEKQTFEFLAVSQSQHVATDYAVFKDPSVSHRWKAELQPAIRDQVQSELHGTKFERFLV
jgi:hypothetical protein